MPKSYIFDTEDAIKYGVDCAIILHAIRYWVDKNHANGCHFYENRYWTYNSMRAWSEIFPFFSESQIRRILDKLIEQKAILTGNFHDEKWKRSLWYTLAEPSGNPHLTKSTNAFDEIDKCICQNHQMQLSESSNGCDEIDKSLTVNIPDIYTPVIISPLISPQGEAAKPETTNDDFFEEFWKAYTPVICEGRCVAKGSKKLSKEKFLKALREGADARLLITKAKEYIADCVQFRRLTKAVPTWINQRCWETSDEDRMGINPETEMMDASRRNLITQLWNELADKWNGSRITVLDDARARGFESLLREVDMDIPAYFESLDREIGMSLKLQGKRVIGNEVEDTGYKITFDFLIKSRPDQARGGIIAIEGGYRDKSLEKFYKKRLEIEKELKQMKGKGEKDDKQDELSM